MRISNFFGDPGLAQTVPSSSHQNQVEAVLLDAGSDGMFFEIQYRSLGGFDVQGEEGAGIAVVISDLAGTWTLGGEAETGAGGPTETVLVTTPGTYFDFDSVDLQSGDSRSVNFLGLFVNSTSGDITIEEIIVVP
ncbi:MAG: hypothetical protein AB8G23_21865, partial [Myxococcota bacterium]